MLFFTVNIQLLLIFYGVYFDRRDILLEITKDDIKKLNDSDLRTLIGKLCEAELYEYGGKISSVSYGGNQDEKDGGIDVQISYSNLENGDFIPSQNTIFQVKRPKMPASKIKKEMKDSLGNIRQCISSLSEKGGAYIIVSSAEDLTSITKKPRINEMKSILSENKLTNIKVDFYDCGAIASWTRKYPSLICWVNQKNGKNTSGWTSYENWSDPSNEENTYLFDNNITLLTTTTNDKLNVIEGISKIRSILNVEKNVVRLAGLSGVGKTRFAQALFDESIGRDALNKEMVIYGDISNSLAPEPLPFIQYLITLKKRLVVIIDNCTIQLHNQLTKLCQRKESKLSLLTIEYDVRDDDNVDSYNFMLSPTSSDLLKKLLIRDFSELSPINIENIVSNSEGNFRIAIYLAKSLLRNGNTRLLNSYELLERLFYQGREVDKCLMQVAQVCSLVYSFDIRMKPVNEEISILSNLISVEEVTLYSCVEELYRRQIIQKRGYMRAILPHALANRLAKEFLEFYPIENLLDKFNKSERLSLSFFRRLKYLFDCHKADFIANNFLDKLSDADIINASENELEKIKCATLVVPDTMIRRLRRLNKVGMFNISKEFDNWISIVSFLAYEEKNFSDSIQLLITIIKSKRNNINPNNNDYRNYLYGFFHIYLSNTCATLETRLKTITEMLESEELELYELGLKLINELLQCGTFTGHSYFIQNTRINDYGLEPKMNEWYECVLDYCNELLNNPLYEKEIKDIIARNFRDLASIGFYDCLEQMVTNYIKNNRWCSIWLSLLEIKHFDSDKVPVEIMERVDDLIEKTKPITIKEKLEIYFSESNLLNLYLLESTDENNKVTDLIFSLGEEMVFEGKYADYFGLIDNSCDLSKIPYLAEGMYTKSSDVDYLINQIVNNIRDNNNKFMCILLSNICRLYNLFNQAKFESFLDYVINDTIYRRYYFIMQLSFDFSIRDYNRFKHAINTFEFVENDVYKVQFFINKLDNESIYTIYSMLYKKIGACETVVSGLLRARKQQKNSIELRRLSREVIVNLDYKKYKVINYNYEVRKLLELSFSKEEGIREAIIIFQKVKSIIIEQSMHLYVVEDDIIDFLIKMYPKEFLNIFIDYEGEPNINIKWFILKETDISNNLINLIDTKEVIDWLEEKDKILELSYVLQPYEYNKIKEKYEWTTFGLYVVNTYSDNDLVVDNIINSVNEKSFAGSGKISDELTKKLNLLQDLKEIIDNRFYKKLDIKIDELINAIEYWELNEIKMKEYMTFE